MAMEVSYTIDYEKHLKTTKYYLENSEIGQKTIETTTFFLLWIICFILLIPQIILMKHVGFCLSAFIYFFFIVLFLIFSKKITSQLYLRRSKKELNKDNQTQVSISLDEKSISLESKIGFCAYRWAYINDIEIRDQYFLFWLKSTLRIIPRYAFQTNESFDNFCQKAREYLNANKTKEPTKWPYKGKSIYYIPILLSFLILILIAEHGSSSGSSGSTMYARKAENFWKEALQSETPEATYAFDTSEAFQKILSKDDWATHIKNLKDKIGEVESISTIGHTQINTSSDEPQKSTVLLRIEAMNDVVYVKTYLVNFDGDDSMIDWDINGYDIIDVKDIDFETQSFSLDEDKQFFEKRFRLETVILDGMISELWEQKQDDIRMLH